MIGGGFGGAPMPMTPGDMGGEGDVGTEGGGADMGGEAPPV